MGGVRLGPLSVEQMKRNVGKRSKLEKHKEDQRKPQEITEDDITRSENETTKNVAAVSNVPIPTRALLTMHYTASSRRSTREIHLFRFIVNPNDFGQSFENLFYLSFLIRDGKCALQIENGKPKICTSIDLPP